MIFTDEKALYANIKAGAPLPVYLLYGADSRRVERCRNAICAAIGESELLRIDGRLPFSMESAADFVMSMSFFGRRRGVLIDDIDLSAINAADFETLCELALSPEQDNLLLITARSASFNPKDKKDKRAAKLREACDKGGAVCEFQKASAADAAALASRLASGRGCVLDREEARLLAEYCGADTVRLENEVEKLTFYSAGGRISREDIELLVAPTVEANVFRLSELLLRSDYEQAMRLIDDLVFLREEPSMLLSMLAMAFSDIYKAKAAERAGVQPAAAAKAFGLNSFRLEKAAGYARRMQDSRLAAALETLSAAELALRGGGGISPREVLETACAEIAGYRR